MTSDVIARLIADFNDLKEKCAHQIEENQNLNQKNQNLQQEIQTLKEKLQEKDKQLELQKSENQYEKLEQNIKNLEKQKSELLQQLEQLEIISQNIRLNKVNDNKVQEKCEPLIKKDNHEQKNHNINNQIILSLNNNINSDDSSIYSLSK
jgi:predicted nuclease with TOPRIM domain